MTKKCNSLTLANSIQKMKAVATLVAAMTILQAGTLPASAGLLAHYPCDTVSSGSTRQAGGTWTDASVSSMTVVRDPQRGDVLQMNASSGFLDLGPHNPLTNSGEFTAMLWVKTAEHATMEWQPLIMKRGTAFASANYFHFGVWDTSQSGAGKLRIEDVNQSVESRPGVAVFGVWVHYAFTAKVLDPVSLPNRITVQVFRDGMPMSGGGGVLDLDPAGADQPIIIGNTFTDRTHAVVGAQFDDIRFYDQAFTAEQIRAAAGIPPFTIGYYDNPWRSLPITNAVNNGYVSLAEGHFNLVHGVGFDQGIGGTDLNRAWTNGLKGMLEWNIMNFQEPIDVTPSTPLTASDMAAIDARATSILSTNSGHPAFLGVRLGDEPPAYAFPGIGYACQKLVQLDPNCLPWVNLLPNYSYGSGSFVGYGTNAYGTNIYHKEYMDRFMTNVYPRVLSYDDYTACNNTNYPPTNYDLYWHYSNLKRFRYYAQSYNIPFWRIIESNLGYGPLSPNTEGIYRFQIFSSLAYGCRGIQYFTFTSQAWYGEALIYGRNHNQPWGTRTAKWYLAQKVNQDIMALAPLLMNLTSWSVSHAGTLPTLPANFAGLIPNVDIETFSGLDGFYVDAITGGNCVLGSFVDGLGRAYLMFVNEDYVANRTLTVTLDALNVAGLGRVDKSTGKLALAYARSPGQYTMSLPLAAGDGELFKVLLDTNAPSAPANLQGEAQSAKTIHLTWDAASDPQSGIAHYCVYRDGVQVGTSSSLSFTNTGLLSGTTYTYRVGAVNGEGLESAQSSPISVSTPVVPRPTIHSIVVASGTVTVAWQSMIGASYQLLKAVNLSAEDWTNAGVPVTATATELSASEPQGTGPVFYRVRVLP
jgi:chitodextrinase